MPPIQLHTKSPINAAKASGVTPQTAAPAEAEADNTPPGAVPRLPEATGTATAPSSSSRPPPPQAAAAPAPAPAPTAAPAPPVQTAGPSLPLPPQMGIPPPAVPAEHHQRGTSTAAAAYTPGTGGAAGTPASGLWGPAAGSGSGSGSAPGPPGSGVGPDGYRQNTSLGVGYVPPAYQGRTARR
ncbi:c52c2032-09ba-4df5-9927-974c401af8c3 [Thermothielavioides terrestris]|uniref:C52c2032-09ba-4df5-9927-974c401af8c3 n=1 Tax=Thermothielavioides terrestris TaxID=2587410 RepID=A0A3S4D4I7_9PEZI|nr:c52c2032-09ba-4df5-9927-974c401af8c3 [Thermothielavioides terrestris]